MALSPPPTTASGWSLKRWEGPSHTEHAEMPRFQNPCLTSEPLKCRRRALAPVFGSWRLSAAAQRDSEESRRGCTHTCGDDECGTLHAGVTGLHGEGPRGQVHLVHRLADEHDSGYLGLGPAAGCMVSSVLRQVVLAVLDA